MEAQVTSVIDQVLPTTVALQIGVAQASGVIVSSDGYVLTAAHVIERPGRSARIIFPDGRTVRGKTLGLNPQVDGGLVQITDPGPWPFAPITPRDEAAQPGDWCLALGHPGGYQPGRTPPVRLGRVIEVNGTIIRTDCTISMGDSGGPLFDMKGQVVGIHSRIADETTMNLHVPAATYQEVWDILKAGEVARKPSRFLTRLDTDGDGKISRAELPDGYRTVFDRMVQQLALDPSRAYSVEDLSKSLGLESPRSFDARQLIPIRFLRSGAGLSLDRFARGRAVRSAFTDLVGDTRRSIVRVKSDGAEVAFGTIVSSNGWVVTKASELSNRNEIVCMPADGRELPARVVHTDTEFDLAILQVEANDLHAVQFQTPVMQAGMWLASPDQSDRPMAIGVVSNAARRIVGVPGKLGIRIDNADGGALVVEVMSASGAASAGLQVNDVITRVGNAVVGSAAELQAEVRKHRVGEVVKITAWRNKMQLDFSVRLGAAEDIFAESRPPGRSGSESLNPSWRGALNQRRDDFPLAIQHDSVLRPNDCGGPVIDSAGRVIGINIARADRTASYALPGSTIRQVLDRFNEVSN
jgi:serine protease Do